MYNRNCPLCNQSINYLNKYTFKYAIDKNSKCKKCSGIKTRFTNNHLKSNKHSLSYTREYAIWINIKSRCHNINNPRYKDYGGRGIILSKEWLNNPEKFISYIKTIDNYDKWIDDKSYSIDRINNDIGYVEGNIRFSNKSEQIYNTRVRNDNKYACKGVYKKNNRFYLRIGGKYIGSYSTIEECINVRNQMI